MFEWKKENELGIASIDGQHKEMFRYANRIYDLLIIRTEKSVDFDEINLVVMELKEYIKFHFRTEEELFERYQYPDAMDHIEEHKAFMEYMETLDIKDIISQEVEFLKELIEKLANWVFHHMITTDYLFKEYLVKLGKDENVRM